MFTTFTKNSKTEKALKIIFVVALTAAIISFAILNILKLINAHDPLISIARLNKTLTGIQVTNAFVCSDLVERITVEKVPRGKEAQMISDRSMHRVERLWILKSAGDWLLAFPNTSNCYIFEPKGKLKFSLVENNNAIDYIVIKGYAPANTSIKIRNIGILYGLYNPEKPIESIKPFVTATNTINAITFKMLLQVDLSGQVSRYFTIVKQNTVQTKSFGAANMIFKLFYSPDTYMISKFTEKQPYTYFDLIGTIGGFLTYALAIWAFLFENDQSQFGRGSTFYFNNSFSTQQKIDATSSMSTTPIYTDEQKFIRNVDARINQKLWFLEQTLSRHYLAGFRLRRYDHELEQATKEFFPIEEQRNNLKFPSDALNHETIVE
ncbi:1379_t:CDS:2 [Ambispora gerdemannii]|uniref:1379_t:CDS:1 n=1 Tax=Ambispora gerdemannii TaxID=144530 RepID=A0A9N9F406_9GLOM|nr:1379_t:CDS:2 [Ambispora gerdemannii]